MDLLKKTPATTNIHYTRYSQTKRVY